LPAFVLLLSFSVLSCGDDDGGRPVVTLEFTPSALPVGIKDAAYSEVVSVSGGTAPYTWSITEGALPAGITMVPAAESVTIAGTPTTVDTFSFTLRTEDANEASATKEYVIQVVESFGVSGNWSVTVDVTEADGVCEGEENDIPGTDTITVTQTATGDPNVFDVTMSGFLGEFSNVLTGTMTGTHITVAGSYPEDGGTTTTRYELTVTGENTMAGDEYWSWSGGGGDCPNGRATVTAVRQ
jgi:hypothetical protein